MANPKEILSIKGITKSYSGVTVLRDMNFSLHEGEIHCLVGENGAGKSTFIKCLSGAIVQDSGEMVLFGNKIGSRKPNDMLELGISTIYQDVDLVDTLTVADNIFLGDEANRAGVIKRKEQERKARELLDELSITMCASAMVEDLSPAQKQTLQMVKALHRDAKILIMDEPTASLGDEESVALMKMTTKLAKSGLGIIYISHYLNEVFEIADTISVLKDGELVNCHKASEVSHDQVIKEMVGRQASLFYDRKRVAIGDTILRAEGMTRGTEVNNVSFEVKKGEVLGIGGLVGSGRTELMNLIFGVDKKNAGEIYLEGKKIRVKSPRDAVRNGICMLGEDRKRDGLFGDRSLLENVCVVRNDTKTFLNLKRDRNSTWEMIQKLNLKTQGVAQTAGSLSGGNQQKSLIARWLLTQSKVIIFDEPTKGVDIGAKEEIYKLIVDLASQGKAIIMVSSDMPEILSMSDRIYVMREGQITHEVSSGEANEESLLKMYLGI